MPFSETGTAAAQATLRKSQMLELIDFQTSIKKDVHKIKKSPSKPSEPIDKCTDMLRNIALFLAISKFLGIMALMVLFLANEEISYKMLLVERSLVPTIHDLPKSIRITLTVMFLQQALLAVFGIAAFSLLNRRLLFFYGVTLIIAFMVRLLPITRAGDQTDPVRTTMFQNFKNNRRETRAINLLQKILKCCGSKTYNYTNHPDLPTGCCQNLTQDNKCTRELAYKEGCEIDRYLLLRGIKDKTLKSHIEMAYYLFCVLLVIETCLALYMFRRLSLRRKRSSLSIPGL